MKRQYVKPEMQRVHLKAEEAVLTACKTWNLLNTGAVSSGVGACEQRDGQAYRCFSVGS